MGPGVALRRLARAGAGGRCVAVTLFQKLSGVVPVSDIATPLLPDVAPQLTLNGAMDVLEGETGREFGPCEVALVKGGGRLLGWVSFGALLAAAQRGTTADPELNPPRLQLGSALHGDVLRVRDILLPVDAGSIISAEASLFEGAKRLLTSADPFLFVLERDLITGTLSDGDLARPAFRACLFAQALELEEVVLDWAVNHRDACWAALSQGRRRRARETAVSQGLVPGDRPLLQYTTLADKGTIAYKLGLVAHLTPREVKSLFAKVERVRNHCAHPSPAAAPILTRDEMWAFLTDCHRAVDAIRQRLAEHD